MQNMILATPILSDAAVLTTSTAPATLPAANLQKMKIGQLWRSLDASAAFVVADLGTAKAINLIALLGHSGSSRSYARIRAAATEADLTAAPAYDSGDMPFRSHQAGFDATWASGVTDEEEGALETNHFMKWFGQSVQTYRWWRVDIVDPNSVYLDVGRLYISKAWQPETNYNYGASEGRIDPSRQGRTAGGQVQSVERPSYRFTEFTLSYASKDEMYKSAFDIERLRGTTRDVLLIPDPEDTAHLQRRILYGTMKGLQPIINSNFSIYDKSYRIEEITG